MSDENESNADANPFKKKKLFGGASKATLSAIVERSSAKEKVGESKKVIRRKSRSPRYRDVDTRRRSFRWSALKGSLSGKKEGLDFLGEPRLKTSFVYDSIMSRYNSYDKDIRNTIDDMVFVLFDSENVSVDDVQKTADKVINVCLNSDSVGVCGTLLEVNDIILFANEELGFVGETKVRKERRLQAYRIADRISEKILPSIRQFQR